ncbi:MAG TPA: PQQ-dependent sugar dehydrogenase, partial [Solirubrobacterales bacterium]|nr:PQQ-dependent sugar dehydrogenase [Solirubrobacterales bacterium]
MRPLLGALLACLAGLGALASDGAAALELPEGFRDDVVFAGIGDPTAVRFAPDGHVFVAEKPGKILVYDGLGDETATVFADLRTEVYDPADRGLLGLAVDPQFPTRPYVYALYTYDHVLGEGGGAPKWGQPDQAGDGCPKPVGADVDTCPVSGRLVRLTADGDVALKSGGQEVQDVLVEDWCQQFTSHSVGDLQFGPGGDLYASGGEGANFNEADFGQFGWPTVNICGDPPGGAGVALSPPSAEGGALRAQDARTPADPTGLDGTLIRIDPDTGAGVAENPMFASADPNMRRIVAYGFRNPFRFTFDPAGENVYLGNVGWDAVEEIDRIPLGAATAYNSGWPCYEGDGPLSRYGVFGLTLCANLYNDPGAVTAPFFEYPHFAAAIPGDPCPADTGSAVSGMSFYTGGDYPDEYDGALFFADPVRGCIYVMLAGNDGEPDPATAQAFLSDGGFYPGISLQRGPGGDLFYAKLFGAEEAGTIHRISFDPSPVARVEASPTYGALPLPVALDAGDSTDPLGKALTYKWDLDGNGSFETDSGSAPTASTFYESPGTVNLGLRVTDNGGKAATTSIPLTVNSAGATSYSDAVLSTPGLISYWRLGEGSGPTFTDSAGSSPATAAGGVTFGVPGAVAEDPNPAARFDGLTGAATGAVNLSATRQVTVEFWLRWTAYANNDALAMEYTPNFNNFSGGFLVDPNSSYGKFAVSLGKGESRNVALLNRPTAGQWH